MYERYVYLRVSCRCNDSGVVEGKFLVKTKLPHHSMWRVLLDNKVKYERCPCEPVLTVPRAQRRKSVWCSVSHGLYGVRCPSHVIIGVDVVERHNVLRVSPTRLNWRPRRLHEQKMQCVNTFINVKLWSL